ncbi:E3 ubiquitin-protein ligase RNF128 [Cryptosporidium felis]|nr:E3 ubiquitin-protein ligase RNF128 [Cryptosporidium felis]
MLIKERINILCKKYLRIQPLFGTREDEANMSPATENSLRQVYARGSLNITSSSSSVNYTEGESYNQSNNPREAFQQQASEDSLMQLVSNYPEKSLWFLRCNLAIGIVSFLSLGILTTCLTIYCWRYSFYSSPFLCIWLLVHGLLQIVQGIFRCMYRLTLEKERLGFPGARILHILQVVRRLTTSNAWKIGKVFSLIYYIWFAIGFYWILSVRPNGETISSQLRDFGKILNESQVEDRYMIDNNRSYLLLGNNSFYSLKDLIRVDPRSGIWSLYLMIMFLCTFRIIAMVSFFYFIFPSVASSEYSENKARACTINKLESLPVKPYSEWRKLKENDISLNQHTFLQDNCIICLNDFTSSEMARCLPCNHVFHEDCIDMWLLRNAVCPLCQVSIR